MKSFKIWIVVGLLVATFVPLGGVVLAETADEAVARVNLPKLEAVRTMLVGLQSQNENKLTIGKAIAAQLRLLVADQTGDVTAEQKTLLQGLSLQVDAMVVKFETDKIKFTALKTAVDSLVCQLRTLLDISCSSGGSGGSGGGGGGGGGGGDDGDTGNSESISNVVISSFSSKAWVRGQTKKVSWSSVGLGGSKIDILVCNQSLLTGCSLLVANISNGGDQDVTLPSSLFPGEGYYIKVRKYNTDSVSGSSSPFDVSVGSASTQTISNVRVSSMEKDVWVSGESQMITWASTGLSDSSSVDILVCNESLLRGCRSVVTNTLNDKNQRVLLSDDTPVGEGYYIKVRKYNTDSVSGNSLPFTFEMSGIVIIPGPIQTISNVTVSSLVNNVWADGNTKQVTWRSTGLVATDLITIAFCDAVTNTCRESSPHIANDGNEQVYFTYTYEEAIGKSYYAKVYKTSNPAIFAKSANFTFSRPPTYQAIGNVSVSYLTNNTWLPSELLSPKPINWTSTGLSGSTVDVSFCQAGSTTNCRVVSSNTANDNSENRSFPFTVAESAGKQYYAKVSKYGNASIFGASNTFTVGTTPAIYSVAVGLANGAWPTNEFSSSKLVRWESANMGSSNVFISVCGPLGGCRVAKSSTANDDNEYITFPFTADESAGKQYYVKVTKYGDATVFGQSSTFSVPNPVTSSTNNLDQMASILSAMEQLLLDLQSQ